MSHPDPLHDPEIVYPVDMTEVWSELNQGIQYVELDINTIQQI